MPGVGSPDAGDVPRSAIQLPEALHRLGQLPARADPGGASPPPHTHTAYAAASPTDRVSVTASAEHHCSTHGMIVGLAVMLPRFGGVVV